MRSLLAILALMLPVAAVAADSGGDPRVSVRETARGAYAVSAQFTVPAPAEVVYAVLTDYENIPKVIPSVKRSRIVRRIESQTIVEQEAVSKFMFFSKRVHLLLSIDATADAISFHDLCGQSFSVYEGSWTILPQDSGTEVRYALRAQPTFDVPLFVIRKVLSADAREMTELLRAEMVRRTSQ